MSMSMTTETYRDFGLTVTPQTWRTEITYPDGRRETIFGYAGADETTAKARSLIDHYHEVGWPPQAPPEHEVRARWLTLIDQAESDMALDWIEGQIERRGYDTPELTDAIATRRREIDR